MLPAAYVLTSPSGNADESLRASESLRRAEVLSHPEMTPPSAFYGRESFATFAGENKSFSSQEPSPTVAMATEYEFSIAWRWGWERG